MKYDLSENDLNIIQFLNSQSKNHLDKLKEDFEKVATLDIVTDDGSYGEKKLATQSAEEFIKSSGTDMIYACGPKPMLKAVAALAEKYGAVCYPAHIDRQSNGIIATLGTFPDIEGFKCFELHDGEKEEEYRNLYPLGERLAIVSSDAHYLWNMRDENRFFLIDDEPYSSALVRKRIFELLR